MAIVISSIRSFTTSYERYPYEGQRRAHPFLEELLASILQASAAFFHRPPAQKHVFHFSVYLVYPLDQSIACFQMIGDGAEVCADMRFLTVRNGAVYESKPVIKLLRCLNRLLWM